jgi:hypothetical protein
VRGLQVLALLAIVVRASSSRAQEALPLDLTWTAPAGCATADEIRVELGRIARVRPGRSIARVAAQGRIEKHGATYSLTLRTERNGQTGERSLVASECRSLEREVTLVLAVAFGEGVEIVQADTNAAPQPTTQGVATEAAAAASTRERATAATPATPSAPATNPESARDETPAAQPELSDAKTSPPQDAQPSPPEPTASRATKARAAMFLGGGVLFATLPSPAFVFVAGGELGWHGLWLEPRLVWLPGVADTLARGVEARYDGWGGALAACVGVPPYAASISACLGADAIALRARSSGPIEGGKAIAGLFAGVLGVAWEWPASGALALRLEAQLHVAIEQPRFIVQGLGEVHRVPRFAPSLAATVVLWPWR